MPDLSEMEQEAALNDIKAEATLSELPELGEDDTFVFGCNEQVPCFNRCCAELTLPLTPYDVRRLTEMLEISSEAFINTYTEKRTFPDTGFPLLMLKMNDGPGEYCPFVSMFGCAVYENRPGACRFFPLGRVTSIGEGGAVKERFVVVHDDHCCGFDEGETWTPRQWIENQGLLPYNASNDKYMKLIAMVKASGKPLDARMVPMVVLCLYQLDKFREFLTAKNVFARLDLDEARCNAIMTDADAALDFAYDWMELVLFGQCPRLKRKM